MKYSYRYGVILLSAFLSGCLPGFKAPLTTQFKESQHKVNVGSVMLNKEIDSRFHSSNSAATVGIYFGFVGGLVGSAIDSSRTNRNLERQQIQLAPLRAALSDFNFDERYHQTVAEIVGSFDWMDLQKVSKVEPSKKTKFLDDQYYFQFVTNYKLSESFDSLEVQTNVTLLKVKLRRLKKTLVETEELFKNSYRYISETIPVQKKSAAEVEQIKQAVELEYSNEIEKIKDWSFANKSAKTRQLRFNRKKMLSLANNPYTEHERKLAMSNYWAKEHGALPRRYLNEALIEIKKMIELDLPDVITTWKHMHDSTIPLHAEHFQTVSKDGERLLLRLIFKRDGRMCSILNDMPLELCSEQF
jgi:hypothetical protein